MAAKERHEALRAAAARGDASKALSLLRSSHGGCLSSGSDDKEALESAEAALLATAPDDGSTVLHALCSGQSLGPLGGCLLWSVRPGGGTAGVHTWPSRHQRARTQLLGRLLAFHPRLVLLAGSRSAAGVTPLHCAVQSKSLGVLSTLLAALQQLLLPDDGAAGQHAPGASSSPSAGTAAAAKAAALHLLLSVPNEEGLSPFELALQRQQWAAARLLAAAARRASGVLPLSQAQMEACDLIRGYLGSSVGGTIGAASGSGGGGGGSSIRVSASGGSVTEALGGLLSKLWDAFGATPPALEAAVEEQGSGGGGGQMAGQVVEGLQGAGSSGGGTGGGSGGAGGTVARQSGGAGSQRLSPAVLRPRALDQAGVLALISQVEQRAVESAKATAAAAAAAAAAEATAAEAVAAEVTVAPAEVAAEAGAETSAGEATESAAAGSPDAASQGPATGIGSSSNGGSPLPGNLAVAPGLTSPAAASAALTSSAALLQQCIVCYDELPPGWLQVHLRCGHPTCDSCWRGILSASIDEGDPRRAACPQPGCPVRLPSSAASRLLGSSSLRRFHQLLAQRHVTAHPGSMRCCPQQGCGAMLQLSKAAAADTIPLPPAAASGAGAAASAAAAAVVETGLDTECGACAHHFCWRCSEAAHEPATCSQMHRWADELAVLRRAAPDADRAWLNRNSKRCPQCKAHIEKLGGCNHMKCRGCSFHFCWVCGREWAQHNTNTGGYYYCNLEQRDDLVEYSAGGSGLLGGPLAWVSGVWASVKAAASQQQLQGQLRQFLRHSGAHGGLFAAAAHMQLLLGASGMVDNGGDGICGSGVTAPAARAAAGKTAVAGPELLGVSASDARRMGLREWGDLLAAAAASTSSALPLPASLAVPAVQAAADAALAQAVGGGADSQGGGGGGGGKGGKGGGSVIKGSGGTSSGGRNSGSGSTTSGGLSSGGEACYLSELAESLADAHSLLQHAAVALFCLPGGPARRHLQALSSSIQRRVEQLEALLLALPEREGLPPPPAPLPAAASSGDGTQRAVATAGQQQQVQGKQQGQDEEEQPGQQQRGGGGGGGGLAGWLLRRMYGVECAAAPMGGAGPLSAEQRASLLGLGSCVLIQQMQFAAAVHQQRHAVQAALAALQRGLRDLRAGARAGAFAT